MVINIYHKYWINSLLVLLLIFCVYCLVTANDLLFWPILKNPYLPLGTFIAWYCLWIFSYLIYLIFKYYLPKKETIWWYKLLFGLSQIGMWMGAIWGIVSALLSGNLNFEFYGGIYPQIWNIYTKLIIIVPLASLLIFGLLELFMWGKRFFIQEKP